jgi:thioredoxin reductase (NADPH)
MIDVVIIGGGPVGLACAIEAGRERLRARVIEKGSLVNSIVGYPAQMEFFSTPELIEIGGYPFPVKGYKPTREDAVEYYRCVTQRENLDVRLYERVLQVNGSRGDFTIVTNRGEHRARHVVVATGFFDQPNVLNVPGEHLPKVTHYYREPYQYVRQKVAVIGAKNSAAKAALDCYRHGADVTLIVRSATLSDKIKYWIRPDLENRIKEGSIRALFNTVVEEIREASLLLRTPDGTVEIDNDWVLAMTGYQPDFRFLESLGFDFADDGYRTPIFDEATFETTRPGVFIAGTVCGGYQTSRWFIENGRFHARQIMKHLAGHLSDPLQFDAVHWKTEE